MMKIFKGSPKYLELERTIGQTKIDYLVLQLDGICPHSCKYCFIGKNNSDKLNNEFLSFNQRKRIIKEALGHGGTSLIEIVERYPGLIDTLVVDESDEKYKEQLEEMGMEVIVTKVSLGDYEHRTQLAELVSKLLLPKV